MRNTTSRNAQFSGKELKKIAYSEASSSEHMHTHIDNKTMDKTLADILGAADRHPNSRVSKLIRLVEEQPSQKNIVILLIELSDHAEYATDLNISLRYYLELFERSVVIDGDLILNEAGLLLLNSSKIYSKRVDYIQSLVEHQIMTLSNADNEIQQENNKNQQKDDKTTPTVKPRRGRKRALGASTDPYEVQAKRKKIRKVTQQKRFTALVNKTSTKKKVQFRNIEVEQQCHPMAWKYATIYDLDDEEDYDTKRNYKLFSYHIEHRFNTLVPDINFRLHYKVKDYLIALEKEMDVDSARNPFYQEVWPSSSEEYVRKYISLENRVLHQEINPTVPYVSPKRNKTTPKLTASLNDADEIITLETAIENVTTPKAGEEPSSSTGENVEDRNQTLVNLVADNKVAEVNSRLGINDSGLGVSDFEASIVIDTIQQENITLSEDKRDQGNTNISENTTPQQENTIISGNTSLANTSNMIEGVMDKSLNVSETQIENDSALGESILDQSDSTNVTTTQLNMTAETEECRMLSILRDKTNTVENLNENANETDGKQSTTGSAPKPSDDIVPVDCEKENICSTEGQLADNNLENNAISIEATDYELDRTGSAISKTCIVSESSLEASETPNHLVSTNKEDQGGKNQLGDGCMESNVTKEIQAPNTEEIEKNLAITNSDGSKNVDLFQVEIEVVNEDGKAESNTIQIQIPSSTDDEGVHLSDAYENDLKLLSPTLKLPDIMPGVERKDVTIYMDKELRDALEMHENMADYYSRETYTVPVIIEPNEQPLVLNILKLPPKILKRKTLFKLGPDMNIYLKARLQKTGKTKEPARTHRLLQSFPLNGVLDTPPQSPGNESVFLGFTDDDSTTCGEFSGFTEEEQIKLLFQRLSRDSGVGVDTSSLPSENKSLHVIIGDNATAASCSLDLDVTSIDADNGTEKRSTEDLLHSLPTELRNVLEAEMDESAAIVNGNSQGDECNKENDNNLANDVKPELLEPHTANETENKSEINCCQSLNANENEKNTLPPDHEAHQNGVLNLSEETIKTDNNCSTIQETIESEQQLDINSSVAQDVCEADGAAANDNPKNTDELAVCIENCDNTNIEANNDCKNQPSQPDIVIVGLGSQGAKTEETIRNESTEPSDNNCSTIQGTIESEQQLDINSSVAQEVYEANGAAANDNTNIEANNDCETLPSQQDIEFFGVGSQGAKTKIEKWHEYLRPILAKSKERHHFDVFQLGTEIIERMHSEENAEQKQQPIATFGDIMAEKDKSYASRYFLSTLLLANQSNIDISVANKSSEMPSSWSDIQFKLLSTKRHTVAIEDNIGMINKKKRKISDSIAENSNNYKKKTSKKTRIGVSAEGEQFNSSDEDCEPLVNLKPKKLSPKRLIIEEEQNSNYKKKKKKCATASDVLIPERPREMLVTSQIFLPPIDVLPIMPSTSKNAILPSHDNSVVNLNQLRVLQPIQKLAKQGDDLDSGIFSVDDMSSS